MDAERGKAMIQLQLAKRRSGSKTGNGLLSGSLSVREKS